MTPLLNDRQLAELLGLTPAAVAQMRRRGQGPTFVRVGGRSIRYRASDVEAYLQARTSTLVTPNATGTGEP